MRDHVRREEWWFVALVTLSVLLLTSLPYIYAEVTAPADKQFMGFVLNVSDHAQYLAWYRGFQSDWLIANRLTSEPNAQRFFNLLWWGLGRLGAVTGWEYPVVYQIFRWIAGAFFLVMVYAFVSLIFDRVAHRKLAFLIIVLGSGLGWVLVVLKYTVARGELWFPLDLYIAEGNSLLCIMAYPHFAEAAGLILLVFWLLLVGAERETLGYAVPAGLVAQLLGWQHGYDLLIVWGIPAVYFLVRWITTRRWPSYWFFALAIVGALSWPPALYSVLLTRLDPLWEEVLAQFANAGVYSPNPAHMLILMGLPLVAALGALLLLLREQVGWTRSRRVWSEAEMFVVTWLVIGWALVYIPTDFQVHMINSWQVPIGTLAALGLTRYALPVLRRHTATARASTLLAVLFLLLILPTNLYLWSWRFYDLHRYDYPYFLHQDEVAALHWVAHQLDGEAVVLSAYETGRYIPALTDARPFLAHWAQTVDFYHKRELVTEFYSTQVDDAWRQQLVQQYDITVVLWGPAERRVGAYTPEAASFLTPVFSRGETTVYATPEAGEATSAPVQP